MVNFAVLMRPGNKTGCTAASPCCLASIIRSIHGAITKPGSARSVVESSNEDAMIRAGFEITPSSSLVHSANLEPFLAG